MKKITLILLTSLLIVPYVAHADNESRSEWVLRDKAKTSDEEINAGSDASFDKRLPPVLPGEEVNDSGKRMKVWSTAGDVPTSEETEYQQKKKRPVGDIDVLVDARRDGRGRSKDR